MDIRLPEQKYSDAKQKVETRLPSAQLLQIHMLAVVFIQSIIIRNSDTYINL